ncbi:CCN family member 2 isoform X2 [Procambarus clarkii]|uniref:CCN family member 2 isoform X2 n=1 Tax=Procambarus clarkii TaxID=6728 RepID=UPI003742619F
MGVWRCVVVACSLAVGVGGQRAPCYECEMYKDAHPHSNPYIAIRAHCVYPCGCEGVPECAPGVRVVMDGCGCCWQCARQLDEPCDGATVCDVAAGLTCHYATTADPTGTCQEVRPAKCTVNNRTYDHGQIFALDCRTQCSCQNGTYACVPLCPSENIPPGEECHNPHLVTVPGQCCREWMCDTDPGKAVGPPACARESGSWSACSRGKCGAGMSVRWTTDNPDCRPLNQTRLCQVRPCQERLRRDPQQSTPPDTAVKFSRKHHIRRGHTCKATQRQVKSVRLRAGWCVSEHRYKPKQCGACTDRCCTVHASTTISVAFLCPLHYNNDLSAPRPRYHILSRLRRTRPVPHTTTTTTTHVPDVYDMMDEGQPILEPALTYPQRAQEDEPAIEEHPVTDHFHGHNHRRGHDHLHGLNHHHRGHSRAASDYYKYNVVGGGAADDHDATLQLVHSNLLVEDDLEYEHIKSDSYEVVHHQVEWILRCKCSRTCEPQPHTHQTQPQATKGTQGTLT